MLPRDMMTLLLSVHRYQFMSVVKDRSAFSEDDLIVDLLCTPSGISSFCTIQYGLQDELAGFHVRHARHANRDFSGTAFCAKSTAMVRATHNPSRPLSRAARAEYTNWALWIRGDLKADGCGFQRAVNPGVELAPSLECWQARNQRAFESDMRKGRCTPVLSAVCTLSWGERQVSRSGVSSFALRPRERLNRGQAARGEHV